MNGFHLLSHLFPVNTTSLKPTLVFSLDLLLVFGIRYLRNSKKQACERGRRIEKFGLRSTAEEAEVPLSSNIHTVQHITYTALFLTTKEYVCEVERKRRIQSNERRGARKLALAARFALLA